MQFSLNGIGSPAEVQRQIAKQAVEIQKGSDPQVAAAAANVGDGLLRFLDLQETDTKVSISLELTLSVSAANPELPGL